MAKKATTITLDPKAKVTGTGKNLYALNLSNCEDDFGDAIVTLMRADSEDDIIDSIFNEYSDGEDQDEFFEQWHIAITLIGKVS